MVKSTGWMVASVAGATALVVGMGLADNNGQVVAVQSRSGRAVPRAVVQEKLRTGEEAQREREEGFKPGEPREAENETTNGPAQQQYDQRAYPRDYITIKRTNTARRAYQALPGRIGKRDFRPGTTNRVQNAAVSSSWQALGPVNPVVPEVVTYTGAATTNSGRVTALMIAPTCDPGDCRLWVAAAGGGIWRTDDATAAEPQWVALDNGLTTNTFGSLAMDPTNPDTIYAGSGEPSGSGDSEAGLGLFKSTDGGDNWTVVPGSYEVAKNRSIAAIVIDPNNSDTIWMGTALARHGSSSVNGGRRTPPDAPEMGIYLSTDGGDNFDLEFSEPGDGVPPSTGSDYFTGGVRRLILDPNDDTVMYASIQGYGVYRLDDTSTPTDWSQIYRSQWGVDNFPGNDVDPYGAMVDFDLADVAGSTRIYLGDTTDNEGTAILYVADGIDALSRSDLLTAQQTDTAPWELRSDPDIADPAGFSSYNWCQNGQCAYDSFVKVDPTNADVVWLGGAMAYDELAAFGEPPISNGRAVVRSEDAGVTFTDMTNDSQNPPVGQHPDQRALVLNPNAPNQAFIGSDGGVVRTSATPFVDGDDCAARGLAGDELTFCQTVTAKIPERIDSLNVGLNTLQFQSLSLNSAAPYTDVIGGTQDNGTWAWDGADNWFESVGGDGGQSGISPQANSRIHTYYGTAGDVNFDGNDPLGWNYVTGPIDYSGEGASFYVPMIPDPVSPGTYFMGAESVWRTQDSGGDPAQLRNQCNELQGTGPYDESCGDWRPIGLPLAPSPSDYIVALGRSGSDKGTLWAGLRYGEIFLTNKAGAGDPTKVPFIRIDTPDTPGRFISGIEVDPSNPNHAWISYSGYGAYTPGQPGHVFEATYDPGTDTASFVERSYDLGDQPVTGIVADWPTGDVYAATDFGVTRLAKGATAWSTAAGDLPPVATYGLTVDQKARVVYAATHGRGAYRLPLDPAALITGPTSGEVGTPLEFDSAGSGGYRSTQYLWKFPDGSTSAAAKASYVPTQAGSQVVELTVTDALGHIATSTQTVNVATKPDTTLTPTFGAVSSTAGGFKVQIVNYNPQFTWTAKTTKGKVSVSSGGLVTVTGLKPNTKATVTVTTDRTGYPQGTASVTGTSAKQCTLTVKAKKQSYKLPKSGTVKLVKKATAKGPKCSLRPVDVQATPLGRKGTARIKIVRLGKGGLKITTYGSKYKVAATYTAKSSKKGVLKGTWNRTWSSK